MELILMKNINKTPKKISMMRVSETMKNSFSKNDFPSARFMFL